MLSLNKKYDDKIFNFEKFFERKESEFNVSISKKDKFMKDLQKSLEELKFEYESKISNLNEKLSQLVHKNKENEDLERKTKKLLTQLRDKEEIINEMKLEIEKFHILKKNCYLLANEIKFE